jgi:cellobiose-specific phosphotransferase system component IIB
VESGHGLSTEMIHQRGSRASRAHGRKTPILRFSRRYSAKLIVAAAVVFEASQLIWYFNQVRQKSKPLVSTAAIQPRAYGPYTTDLASACMKPERRWFGDAAQTAPIKRGLFFLKLFKAGSSTAAAIHSSNISEFVSPTSSRR